MVTEWLNSPDDIIDGESEKQKRPVVVAFKPDAGKGVVGKPEFYAFPRKRMDSGIIDYPIIIIPKQSSVQIKGVDQKADGRQENNQC